jgi:hypothetical protein
MYARLPLDMMTQAFFQNGAAQSTAMEARASAAGSSAHQLNGRDLRSTAVIFVDYRNALAHAM